MKLFFLSVLCLIFQFSYAQLSIETFENETNGAKTFNDQSVTFTIQSSTGNDFEIVSFPDFGWNGTAADNKFIENFNSNTTSPSLTISTQDNSSFLLKSMYLYIGYNGGPPNPGANLTITGKRGGVQVFAALITSGFNTNPSSNNGFTFIDLSNFGSQNNSNKIIDQVIISGNNSIDNIALDAFKWYKNNLTATTASTNVSCNGGTNGSASVSVSGGVTPYSYSWSPSGGISSTATGLAVGVYTCTITDAAGGTLTKSVTITQPSALVASTASIEVSCFGGSNGVASVAASGGAGGYTYNWTGGGTASSITGKPAGNYSCVITDANSCTITKSVTITQPAAFVASSAQTNISCYGGNNGSASVTVSGGAGGYTYNWSPSGGTASTATGLTAGNYTCTIRDANSCQISRNFSISQPDQVVINSITPVSSCLGDEVTVNVSSNVTLVQWKKNNMVTKSSNNFTTVTANNTLNNTYIPPVTGTFIAVVYDVSGCSATSSSVTITDAAISSSNLNQSLTLSGDTYFKNGCSNLIAMINPTGASPVSGNVDAKVWIESVQPSAEGSQFLKRHYELTPSSNASTATGKITLFFTQAEFDEFNAIAAIDLPTSSSDAIGKANLLVEKRDGVSSDGTGLPNSYSGSISTINPTDGSIVWNSTASRWEVSFDVTGFSGFFVKTMSGTLPVTWLNFSGMINSDSKVMLNWKVNELNVKSYSIEKSIDAGRFYAVGAISGKGNGNNSYQFIESVSLSEHGYYRIKQIDHDGKYSYSSVIKLQSIHAERMQVFPTPFKNNLTILSPILQKAWLYNSQGQAVREIGLIKGTNLQNTDLLKPGTYILKAENGYRQKLLKQ